MKSINWARKLTSRKFWAAIANFVSMMFIFSGGTESVATQITALIMAGGTVIAYIIAEGFTDSANKEIGEDLLMETEDDI